MPATHQRILATVMYGRIRCLIGRFSEGTAAMAVILPFWNLIYSFGLLVGMGGFVLFSTLRGKAKDNIDASNEYLTAEVIVAAFLSAAAGADVICFAMLLIEILRQSTYFPKW